MWKAAGDVSPFVLYCTDDDDDDDEKKKISFDWLVYLLLLNIYC